MKKVEKEDAEGQNQGQAFNTAVNRLHGTLTSMSDRLGLSPSSAPNSTPWEAATDDWTSWVPVTHVGDSE